MSHKITNIAVLELELLNHHCLEIPCNIVEFACGACDGFTRTLTFSELWHSRINLMLDTNLVPLMLSSN